MKLNPDSPELTAYVLGELDAARTVQVEAALADDPSLRAEVELIRALTLELSQTLAIQAPNPLSPFQREQILRTAVSASSPKSPHRPGIPALARGWRQWLSAPYGWGVLLAGTAAVVLTFALGPHWHRDDGENSSGRTAGPKDTAADFDRLRYQVSGRVGPVAVNQVTGNAVPVTRGDGLSVNRPASAVADGTVRTGLGTGVAGGAGALSSATDKLPAAPNLARAENRAMEPALMRRYGLEMDRGASPAAPTTVNPGSRSLAYESPVPRAARAPGVDSYPGGATEREISRPYLRSPVEGIRTLPVRPRSTGEGYAPIVTNPFRPVAETPLSTFGLDVDTASYANIRRFLREGSLPPPDAVRLEEMVNYFRYDSPAIRGEHPVAAQVEVAECPWKPEHRLVRVTVKARDIVRSERPRANLVFLVDVSGSMEPENRLPLVQRTLRLLTERVTARDSVAIVTYAGEAGVALPPTNGGEKAPILAAIERLRAGGSTHGSAGIRTAYELARTNFIRDGVNRIILCTDGDFNVGLTSREDLLALISEEARSGVFLTVLGYGMGNYQDATTELLADRGNGNHAYIDSFREAQKVMGEQLESTLVTVAKDVKLQIEFNPERVVQWRLLGYEKRLLADRDFNDDTKDAGELGAGHLVTALYELMPVGGIGPGVDPLRYQAVPAEIASPKTGHPDELLNLKLRYKLPDGDTSRLLQMAVKDTVQEGSRAGTDLKFSAAVAGFAMLLRDTEPRGSLNYDLVLKLAEQGLGEDREGYRGEFIDLVRRARQLSGK